jgi:hypothetical protein
MFGIILLFFIYLNIGGGVKFILGPLGTAATPGLLYLPRVIMRMESWWDERFWQGKPNYSEETCPDATLSTINPTCHTWARTRAAAVGSQWLTASAMARPLEFYFLFSSRSENKPNKRHQRISIYRLRKMKKNPSFISLLRDSFIPQNI